jgi:hypothetical protein
MSPEFLRICCNRIQIIKELPMGSVHQYWKLLYKKITIQNQYKLAYYFYYI